MDFVQLGFAYTAGILSFLSPCALPMLPAYVTYFIGNAETQFRILQTIYLAVSLLTGFLMTFIVIWIIPSFLLSGFSRWLLFLTPAIGVILIILGLMAIFTSILERVPRLNIKTSGAEAIPFVVYGIFYGAASLGCSLPIFLLVIMQGSSADSLIDLIYLFTSYGLGAATIIVPFTLTLALTKSYFHKWALKIMPYIKNINGVVLIIAGVYMFYTGFHG